MFVGHRSHQSARYEMRWRGEAEAQSSSGVILATGTGLTGWARSISRQAGIEVGFAAHDPHAAFFAREPWPSRATGTALAHGVLSRDEHLEIVSRMEGGVVFADGIETDYLDFGHGERAELRLSRRVLRLVGA